MIFRCLLPFLNFRFFFASSLLWVPKSLFRSITTRQADRSQRLEHTTFEIASPCPPHSPSEDIMVGGCKIKRMNIFFPQSLRWVMESRAELSTMIITELVRGEGRTGLRHPRRKLSWRRCAYSASVSIIFNDLNTRELTYTRACVYHHPLNLSQFSKVWPLKQKRAWKQCSSFQIHLLGMNFITVCAEWMGR